MPRLPTANCRPVGPDRVARPALRAAARPTGKIVCIGLNYRDHAAETGAACPAEPILFLKDPDTVVGPDDTVLVPRASERPTGRSSSPSSSAAPPATSTADAEAARVHRRLRDRQRRLRAGVPDRARRQWDKGKNCETFNPLGPWLVTADEVADPQALGLRLWVNGELKQDGTTANMIFAVLEVVRYLSQFMVLHPGDVINTGTPAGVALGQPEPKPFLRAGDVVELEIDGLGRQRQVLGQA